MSRTRVMQIWQYRSVCEHPMNDTRGQGLELRHVKTKQLLYENVGGLFKALNILPFQINNWSTKLVDQLEGKGFFQVRSCVEVP